MLIVTECDGLAMKWSELTNNQRAGIKGKYLKYCDSCQVGIFTLLDPKLHNFVEYNFNDLLFFRAGQSHGFMDAAEQGLSLGFGLNYQIPRGPKIRIDYVQTDFGVFNSISGYSINFFF